MQIIFGLYSMLHCKPGSHAKRLAFLCLKYASILIYIMEINLLDQLVQVLRWVKRWCASSSNYNFSIKELSTINVINMKLLWSWILIVGTSSVIFAAPELPVREERQLMTMEMMNSPKMKSLEERVKNLYNKQRTLEFEVAGLNARLNRLNETLRSGSKCPSYAHEINNVCYYIGVPKLTRDEANDACIRLNGELSSIQPTDATSTFLETLIDVFTVEASIVMSASTPFLWVSFAQTAGLDAFTPLTGPAIPTDHSSVINQDPISIQNLALAISGGNAGSYFAEDPTNTYSYLCTINQLKK